MQRNDSVSTIPEIDRKSFILGMITAFAECLANECKKGALSPPFYLQDYDGVCTQAEQIAKEQGIFLWYDKNEDIPEENRINWWVMYKFPEVLEDYQELRRRGYNPAWHLEKFLDFLSYGTIWGQFAEKVVPQYREKRPTDDTVGKILLTLGGWPSTRKS
jgi:hypothetical protein